MCAADLAWSPEFCPINTPSPTRAKTAARFKVRQKVTLLPKVLKSPISNKPCRNDKGHQPIELALQ